MYLELLDEKQKKQKQGQKQKQNKKKQWSCQEKVQKRLREMLDLHD